jgi:hypothetical protein
MEGEHAVVVPLGATPSELGDLPSPIASSSDWTVVLARFERCGVSETTGGDEEESEGSKTHFGMYRGCW